MVTGEITWLTHKRERIYASRKLEVEAIQSIHAREAELRLFAVYGNGAARRPSAERGKKSRASKNHY
jgi:hypothetical protein